MSMNQAVFCDTPMSPWSFMLDTLCQWSARAEWLERRNGEPLDCEYFHLVFTLPGELAPLALRNRPRSINDAGANARNSRHAR